MYNKAMNRELFVKWMEQKDLRAEDVASKLGIHFNTVYSIINGRTKRPNRLTVAAIAELMGVPLKDLYDVPEKHAI